MMKNLFLNRQQNASHSMSRPRKECACALLGGKSVSYSWQCFVENGQLRSFIFNSHRNTIPGRFAICSSFADRTKIDEYSISVIEFSANIFLDY